ncbi:MAG: hypothetical protein WA081_10000 [Desulfosalsimonadaceae bacterium]
MKNIKIPFMIVSLRCHYKNDQIVMPDLIRHPEHANIGVTGFRLPAKNMPRQASPE